MAHQAWPKVVRLGYVVECWLSRSNKKRGYIQVTEFLTEPTRNSLIFIDEETENSWSRRDCTGFFDRTQGGQRYVDSKIFHDRT